MSAIVSQQKTSHGRRRVVFSGRRVTTATNDTTRAAPLALLYEDEHMPTNTMPLLFAVLR